MTFLIAVVCLLAGLVAGIFALRPRAIQSLDVAVDMSDSSAKEDFSLSRSLLLIGPEMNDADCKAQRRELKRILGPLLEAKFKIIEIYGDTAPAENGEPYDWLDNQLMRKTLNAEAGFHLIHVNSEGKTGFHSGRVITAEALLHIFDLWDFITEDAGEDLTNIEDEETAEVRPVEITAPVDQVIAEESQEFEKVEEEFAASALPAEIPAAEENEEPVIRSAVEVEEPVMEEKLPQDGQLPQIEPVSTPPLTEEEKLIESLKEATHEHFVPQNPPDQSEVSLAALPELSPEPAEECRRAPKSISQAIKKRTSAGG